MTTSVRGGLVGLALMAVLSSAACNDPAPVPPTMTATPPTTTSATSPPSSTTPADPRLSAAEAVVGRFWSLVNALGADPRKSLDQLTTVARGQTFESWRDLLTQRRRQGYVQVGSISIVSSSAKASGPDEVTVDACVDVSKTDLVDKAGKSVVSKDRAPRVHYAYVVQQATDGKFYIMQDKAAKAC